MWQFPDTPYLLARDFNIDPMHSPALDAAVSDGNAVDLFAEWAYDELELSPTFCRTGVCEGMKALVKQA